MSPLPLMLCPYVKHHTHKHAMKKIILLAGAMLLLLAGQSAQAAVVVTTCGKAIMTVGPEGFPGGWKEYKKYLREINLRECGYEADAQVMVPMEPTSVGSMTEYHPLAELTLDLKINTPIPSQSEQAQTTPASIN